MWNYNSDDDDADDDDWALSARLITKILSNYDYDDDDGALSPRLIIKLLWNYDYDDDDDGKNSVDIDECLKIKINQHGGGV